MIKSPRLLAVAAVAALSTALVGGSTLSANADTPKGGHMSAYSNAGGGGGGIIPWNSSYYLQSYTCPGLVGIAFRGSGEGRNPVDPSTDQEIIKPTSNVPAYMLNQLSPGYEMYASGQFDDSLILLHDNGPDGQESLQSAHPQDSLITNGWEGSPISRLLQAWTSLRYFPSTGEAFPVIGVGANVDGAGYGYKAIPVGNWLQAGRDIMTSGIQGGQAGVKYMQYVKDYYADSGCKVVPRFILFGYSQGAVAARIAAISMPNDVLSAYFFGDAYLSSASEHHKGNWNPRGESGNTGTGLLRDIGAGAVVARGYYPNEYQYDDYDKTQERYTYCHNMDSVCDFAWAQSVVGGHLVDDMGTDGPHEQYVLESGATREPNANRFPEYEYAQAGIDLSTSVECIQARVVYGDDCAYTNGGHTFQLKGSQLEHATALNASVGRALQAAPKLSVTPAAPGQKTLISVPRKKGAVYRFDFDGNGKWDLKTKQRTVNHVYKKAGSYHLKVQVVKGHYKKSYKATVKVKALSLSATAGWYSKAYDLDKTTSLKINSSASATLKISGLPAKGQYALRFVQTAGDPLETEPTKVAGPYTADATGSANVNVSLVGLPKGVYKTIVVTPTGYHAEQTVTVK